MRMPALLTILALSAPALAAAGEGDGLAAKREAKLAEGWVASGGWTADYEKALETAKETGKPVFAYFTRSYAG